MQMHNGTRTGEGSFNVGLKELFYLADNLNRHKLVEAFPCFFGDEVPEFKIKVKKDFKYRNWLCKWKEEIQGWELYTPDELQQPVGFRECEFECYTISQCEQFINSY